MGGGGALAGPRPPAERPGHPALSQASPNTASFPSLLRELPAWSQRKASGPGGTRWGSPHIPGRPRSTPCFSAVTPPVGKAWPQMGAPGE